MAMQQMIRQPELERSDARWPEVVSELRPVPAAHPEPAEDTLQLHLLGTPEICVAGRAIVLRTRKTLALLIYLALQGGQQSREQLADLLWPEADIDDARASLRTTLSYIRQGLGDEADTYLLASREFVGLQASAPIDLDVAILTDVQNLSRQAPDRRILRRRIENAVALCRGPFLAGLSLPDAPDFEAWLEGQRAHWRGVEAELLEHLAALQVDDGDTGAAVTTLERWTSMDPDEESPWKMLIDLHLQHDDPAGARRVWKGYRQALAEIDAEASPTMAALGERIESVPAHSQSMFGASSPGSADLDVRALPFVGRSGEWSALLAAFERSRSGMPEMVVVEGVAGVGKTRLISRFLSAAAESGADVVLGQALETAGELPYAAVIDALRARLDLENAPDDLLGDLWLGELAHLVPELRERYPDLPVIAKEPALARVHLFEAVARLGQALAQRKPLVFCLDDAQWTDVATRDLLRYVIRRWSDEESPVLVILAVRSEDLGADHDLAQWVQGLERDVPAVRLVLSPLERGDVVQLVCRLAGHPFVDTSDAAQAGALVEFGTWLVGETQGHPLSLVHAVRSLLERNALEMRPGDDGAWTIAMPAALDAGECMRLSPRFSTPSRGASLRARMRRIRSTSQGIGVDHVVIPRASQLLAGALCV